LLGTFGAVQGSLGAWADHWYSGRMLPALVIFDFDGVLCRAETFTPDAIRLGLRRFGERVGVPIAEPDEAALLATLGYPSTQTYPPMLPESVRARWPEMHDLTLGAMEERIRALGADCLYPGALALLDDLVADGRVLALASNCSERYQRVHDEVHDLGRRFTHLWHAQAPGIASKADMVGAILAAEPHLADSVVLVGDRLSDRNAAARHGVPFIACRYGFGAPEEWSGAVAYADGVDDLRPLLGIAPRFEAAS